MNPVQKSNWPNREPPPDEQLALLSQSSHTPREAKKSLGRFVAGEMWIALLLYTLLNACAWIASARLPAGRQFSLEPRGWGVICEILASVLGLTLFCIVYGSLAFSVRRSIGCLLRALLFGIFTVFLATLQFRRVIAVVETPTDFIFVKPFPVGQVMVPLANVRTVDEKDTGMVRSVTIETGQGNHGIAHIECRGVWKEDAGTNRVLDQLIARLRMSHSTAHEKRE